MIKRQTSLPGNVVQFCRLLRLKGFAIGVPEESNILAALQFIDIKNREDFSLLMRSICCRSVSQLKEFDELFLQYWIERNIALDSKIKTNARLALNPPAAEVLRSLSSWLNGNRSEKIEKTAAYSVHENLLQKDFSAVLPEELDDLMRMIKAWSRKLAVQVKRRDKKSSIKKLPDLRATIRKNMRYGGELINIVYKKPKHNRTRLVILCDVSQSMELYTTFLLQFLFAFQQVYRRSNTYAFSTTIQRISPVLSEADFRTMLRALQTRNTNWNSGTKIGESFMQYIEQFGKKELGRHTTVIVLSDGWDTGALDALSQSMHVLKSRSKKLIWLNPGMGFTGYQPQVAGMQVALPFISIFAPVHNLESLKKLGSLL